MSRDDDNTLPELPKLPAAIGDRGEFRSLLLAAARASLEDVAAAVRLELPAGVDEVARDVVRAHMTRLYKLFDAYLALLEWDRRDPAIGLCWTMMEILINVDYLFAADDLPRRSRAFIARSAERLLSPVSYLHQQVHSPDEPDDEENLVLFFAGYQPIVDLRVEAAGMLRRSGVMPEEHDLAPFMRRDEWKSLLKEWPRDLRQRATSGVAKEILNTEFAEYSLAVHPNWRDMELRDLTYSESSDGPVPCLESFWPEDDEILRPFGWCVAAAARHAAAIGSQEAKVLYDRFSLIHDYILGAAELRDREFERLCSDVDDGESDSDDDA